MRTMCIRNKGYQWTESSAGCFRGYIQPSGYPIPLRGEEALQYLSRANSFEGFLSLLNDLDGIYVIALWQEDGTVWAAVDSTRSIPLYYSADGRFLSDSGAAIREALEIPKEAADRIALEELFYSGFIAGSRTAYSEIFQLDAGQALDCAPSGEIRTVYYYKHAQAVHDISREEALDRFQQVSDEAFDRIIAAIAGRPVVLSLSGGYDSRYVACMLKRRGVKDVSCYTYGRTDSFEIQQSSKIAKALGYRWTCVEYTDERMRGILDSIGQKYFEEYSSYDYAMYFQNFPAVRYLHESGWIKPGSVFLTGLCNDMPTGYYETRLKKNSSACFSLNNFSEAVMPAGGFEKLSDKGREVTLSVIETQRQALGLSPANSYQDFVSAVDCLWTIRDHSRQFLHMNDIHGFFGYEWLLPCWSRELLEFWYSLPLEYRLFQNLYEEWITTKVPAQYGVGQKKIVMGYPSSPGWERTKARLRLLLNRTVCFPLGISVKDKRDFNNFDVLAKAMFHSIHQKKLIGFRNASINPIGTLYQMEQLYGSQCLSK